VSNFRQICCKPSRCGPNDIRLHSLVKQVKVFVFLSSCGPCWNPRQNWCRVGELVPKTFPLSDRPQQYYLGLYSTMQHRAACPPQSSTLGLRHLCCVHLKELVQSPRLWGLSSWHRTGCWSWRVGSHWCQERINGHSFWRHGYRKYGRYVVVVVVYINICIKKGKNGQRADQELGVCSSLEGELPKLPKVAAKGSLDPPPRPSAACSAAPLEAKKALRAAEVGPRSRISRTIGDALTELKNNITSQWGVLLLHRCARIPWSDSQVLWNVSSQRRHKLKWIVEDFPSESEGPPEPI
jgi:hypothetical protein